MIHHLHRNMILKKRRTKRKRMKNKKRKTTMMVLNRTILTTMSVMDYYSDNYFCLKRTKTTKNW
jgi:hypothetical protein